MGKLQQAVAVSVIVVLVAGCMSGRLADAGYSVSDSAGVKIVRAGVDFEALPTWHFISPAEGQLDSLQATIATALSNRVIGRPSGMSWSPDHGLAFGDDGAKTIVVVPLDGEGARTVGRSGSGPGEFIHVGLTGLLDDGAIVARDGVRQQLVYFPADGGSPSSQMYGARGWGYTMILGALGDHTVVAAKVESRARPSPAGTVFDSGTAFLLPQFDADSLVELGTFAIEERVLRQRDNGGLTGGDPPMPRNLVAAVSPETVVLADAGDPALFIYTATGKLLRIIRLDLPQRQVTSAIRNAYREAAVGRYGERNEEWERLTADDVFPEAIPSIHSLHRGRDGSMWITSWPEDPARDGIPVLVIDSAGHPEAHGVLPMGFSLQAIGMDHVFGWGEDSAGAPIVAALRIRR